MFKNRTMQVKLVKDPKKQDQEDTQITEIDPNEVVDHVSEKAIELGTLAVQGAVILIAAYFGADTLRQVIVKSTPGR